MRLLLCLALVMLTAPASAQTVSSLDLPGSYKLDGIYAAPDGYLYAAGGYNSDTIYQISAGGTIAPYASGIDGPIHMAMNGSGELYVSSFNNQTIYKVGEEGALEAFAVTLIRYPTGMVFGPDGELYVAHAEPSYGIGGISRIETDGTASVFARGGGIDRPVGLAMDEAGNLYAANWYDTAIHRISPAGDIELFSSALPQVYSTTIGHLVYADGYLYGTDVGHHQILRFDTSGSMEVFAGSGVKNSENGSLTAASFDNPNGITISRDGQTLYVASQWSKPFLRTVSLTAATDTRHADELPASISLAQNHPNPFNPSTTIAFDIGRSGPAELHVYDLMGRRVMSPLSGMMPAGHHEVRIDASALPSGTYVYRLQTDAGALTRTMTLLK